MALDGNHVAGAGDHVGDHILIDSALATKQPSDADLTAIAALDATVAGMIATDGAGWIKKTYAQVKTALTLGNVDNTSDANKPVSTAQATAIALRAPNSRPYQFRVEDYGAVGDNSTDDTASINSAIAAAITYAQANKYYCEVLFDPTKTYLVSAATTKNTTIKGNSQIPLPVISSTGQKVVIVFKGGIDSSAFPHWLQTTPQRSGATIRSTSTAAYDATFGFPSVIGTPQPEQGYGHGGLFSNMQVVIDGLRVEVPSNPSVHAVDLQGAAQAKIISLSSGVTAQPSGAGSYVMSTNFGCGLRMPAVDNNDQCTIIDHSAQGFYRGIILGEHTIAHRLAYIYCRAGLATSVDASVHSIHVNYLSTEYCMFHVEAIGGVPLTISNWDIEDGLTPFNTNAHLYDPGNILYGEAKIVRANGASVETWVFNPNGGANFKSIVIVNSNSGGQGLGYQAMAALPASTVATQVKDANGRIIWRDVALTLTGGTVTAIVVDGHTTGLTSGTIIVPSGKTYSITYSVAPTGITAVVL
jgi:hypothetical protein